MISVLLHVAPGGAQESRFQAAFALVKVHGLSIGEDGRGLSASLVEEHLPEHRVESEVRSCCRSDVATTQEMHCCVIQAPSISTRCSP